VAVIPLDQVLYSDNDISVHYRRHLPAVSCK
jgi:hypothetical protein